MCACVCVCMYTSMHVCVCTCMRVFVDVMIVVFKAFRHNNEGEERHVLRMDLLPTHSANIKVLWLVHIPTPSFPTFLLYSIMHVHPPLGGGVN